MRTPARYQRLARVIVDEATRHCDEVDLEFYLAAERGGKDAPTLYPRIHQHLQVCARCREDYEQRRQGSKK